LSKNGVSVTFLQCENSPVENLTPTLFIEFGNIPCTSFLLNARGSGGPGRLDENQGGIDMSLQEKLDAQKAKSSANRPPEIREAFERALNEQRASGILERVPKVGSQAPQFTLSNQDGVMVSSAALLAQGPLVLTIYRGHW
jgi:hypothetical protein